MRNDRIRFIKGHCFSFKIGDIQKQYKRNGDLVFKENFTKRSTTSESEDYDSGLGTWDYSSQTGILDYISENGDQGLDITNLDLYSLINIDTDTDGYLFASIPYNIIDDVSFEIDNSGIFIINDNN